MSSTLLSMAMLFLFCASVCFAQDPLPVIKSSWQATVQKAQKVESSPTGPARQIIPEDKVGPRTAREFSTVHPDNPSDQTPDGRRSVIEKNEADANMPQPQDKKGFTYSATVRNDSSKTVKVIFWEYRFVELAHPENVVRRQFLCAVNLKKGAEMDLTSFSSLGPTDVVDADSLSKSNEKRFDEHVQVNRIEYSDDDVVQRGTFKYADVKTAVDRATSKPWGKEVCRAL